MTDHMFTLVDRLAAIRSAYTKYDLEHNAYISFSGGKDSTILHELFDLAIPGNNIPRVFCDTGIEYNLIRKFVYDLREVDPRIDIIKPKYPIKKVLDTYGYPFKSKEHSLRVYQFNRGNNPNFIRKYIFGYSYNGKRSPFVCPKCLLYQFEEKGKYNYSNLCCFKLKKEPMHHYAKLEKRKIFITGMRKEEGGQRASIKGCILTDKKGNVTKFHPLLPVSDEFENWFVDWYKVKLCDLYYPPYNFNRTGCKGCPFSLTLKEDLATMALYLPNERKQCEIIWKPVYEEYRRINFRLDSTEQLKLF